MRIEPSRVKRVLVIGLSCVGDMILATAALWNLRRFLPQAHFTILAGVQAKQVLDQDPLWDVVEVYKRKKGFWGRLESARLVRSIPHDLLIDLRSSAMPLFCGARYAPLWGWREFRLPKTLHEAEKNVSCMCSLGVPVYSRQLRFFIPQSARLAAKEELVMVGAPLPWILFNPGSNSIEKNWPAGRFSALARVLLAEADVNIGIVGYSDYECDIAAEICDCVSSSRCVDLSGRYSMSRLGALLEQTLLFVTNDTGPLHVASAIGTPTVGLYLSRNLARFGPWGNAHRALVAPETGEGIAMESIQVDEVLSACRELLGNCSPVKCQEPSGCERGPGAGPA